MEEAKRCDVIKGVLYNRDGTVDYVFDDAKLNEIISPFRNENNMVISGNKTMIMSRLKDFESADIRKGLINDV